MKSGSLASYRKGSSSRLRISGSPLVRTNSTGGFLERILPRIFKRSPALSVALEGDTPSQVTLQEEDISGAEAGDAGRTTEGSPGRARQDARWSFACHLCSFTADRITLLDRHLLDDHKIGLDNLLKLIMANAKSKDNCHGVRTPYYQLSNENEELDTSSVFERLRNWQRREFRTVATNTEAVCLDERPRNSCSEVTRQLEKLLSEPLETYRQSDLASKMAALQEAVSGVVGSSAASCMDSSPLAATTRLDELPFRGIKSQPLSRYQGQRQKQEHIPLQQIF